MPYVCYHCRQVCEDIDGAVFHFLTTHLKDSAPDERDAVVCVISGVSSALAVRKQVMSHFI